MSAGSGCRLDLEETSTTSSSTTTSTRWPSDLVAHALPPSPGVTITELISISSCVVLICCVWIHHAQVLEAELQAQESQYHRVLARGQDLMSKAYEANQHAVQKWMRTLKKQWSQLTEQALAKRNKLHAAMTIKQVDRKRTWCMTPPPPGWEVSCSASALCSISWMRRRPTPG